MRVPGWASLGWIRLLTHKRRIRNGALYAVAALLLLGVIYSALFGPPGSYAQAETFVIQPGTSTAEVARELKDQGYVKVAWVTRVVLASKAGDKGVRPGGYDIGKHMDLWTLSDTFAAPPHLVFVTIPQSVRKEEIGDILADELYWDDEKKQAWKDATDADDLSEGVYYPDTYLIPGDQPPAAIAARLRGRFADVFAPYADEAREKGMDWNQVLTLASLIDKEAGANDKELVAGILWNRVERGMPLQVDATLQYVRGTEKDWWPTPRSADKYIDSPFNTYMYGGLPPHPINNPRESAVAAALNPTSTDCLFYIHANQQIHCSVTYAGQKENVDRYLR